MVSQNEIEGCQIAIDGHGESGIVSNVFVDIFSAVPNFPFFSSSFSHNIGSPLTASSLTENKCNSPFIFATCIYHNDKLNITKVDI